MRPSTRQQRGQRKKGSGPTTRHHTFPFVLSPTNTSISQCSVFCETVPLCVVNGYSNACRICIRQLILRMPLCAHAGLRLAPSLCPQALPGQPTLRTRYKYGCTFLIPRSRLAQSVSRLTSIRHGFRSCKRHAFVQCNVCQCDWSSLAVRRNVAYRTGDIAHGQQHQRHSTHPGHVWSAIGVRLDPSSRQHGCTSAFQLDGDCAAPT